MEISIFLGCLYFAVCFSIVAIMCWFLAGLNVWGILRSHSMWRFSKRGVVNWLWLSLFVPCGVAASFVAVVFWHGVFLALRFICSA